MVCWRLILQGLPAEHEFEMLEVTLLPLFELLVRQASADPALAARCITKNCGRCFGCGYC